MRKSPIKHKVQRHKRNRKQVRSYTRGKGSKQIKLADPTLNFNRSVVIPTVKIVDYRIYKISLPKDMKLSEGFMRQFLHDCAEHVLPIFEDTYPNDNRPRKALEALQLYINQPTEENRQDALMAVDAAEDVINKKYGDEDSGAQDMVYAIHRAALQGYSDTSSASDIVRAMWQAADRAREAAENIRSPDSELRTRNQSKEDESDWQQAHLNNMLMEVTR